MTTVPRDDENRFRLYALGEEGLVIAATGPTLEHIGAAFGTLLAEEQFDARDRIGVLDTHGDESVRGTWIVNPHGRTRG